MDLDGIITYANQAACAELRLSRDRLIGKPLRIIGRIVKQDITLEEFVAATLFQDSWRGRITNTRRDAAKSVFDCHAWLFKDDHGQNSGIIGVLSNITEEESVREALTASEDRYRSLFHNSEAVMLIVDPAARQIRHVNPAACDFYGYPAESLCRMNLRELQAPDRTDLVANPLLEVLSDRELELFALTGQGKEITVIAEIMNISPRTVEVHRSHIKKKLGLRTSTEIFQRAYDWLRKSGLQP